MCKPQRGIDVSGLGLIAAGVGAAVVVAMFVLAHLALLAGCAAVFVVVMGGFLAATRWVASPARMRRQLHPQYARTAIPARPPQRLSAPRARAIEAPRAVAIARILPTEDARIKREGDVHDR